MLIKDLCHSFYNTNAEDCVSDSEKKEILFRAFKIVTIYLVISLLWIFFSDSFVYNLVSDESLRKEISIVKGWLFVIVTSILLFYLIFRNLLSYHKLKQDFITKQKRWEYALINVNDGLWDWDLTTNETFFSVQWKEMIGYSDDELKNEYGEWQSRVHPNDLAKALDKLNDYVAGRSNFYYSEFRMRTKSGKYIWILDRGKITEYSADGKPLRMIGTHTNINEQKQLEQDLRKKEERYRIISENSGNVVWVYDLLKGSFEFISPTMQEFMGNSFEDVKVRERKEFLMECSIKTILGQLPDRIHNYEEGNISEKIKIDEVEKINEDGTAYYIELNTSLIHGEDGLVTEILGVTRDITERKESELKISESEEKYRSVFENSNIAILISKPDGTILSANHEAEKLFNMSEAEFIACGRAGVVDITDPAFNEYLAIRNKDHRVSSEFTLIKKGGERFIGKVSSVSFNDRNGTVLNTVVISDLTEQKQAEEILRKSEEQYRTIFEYSPVAAVFWDKETHIIFWNKAAEKMFGWEKEEVIGRKFTEFFIPEKSMEFTGLLVNEILSNIPREVVFNENITKNGNIILCEWNNTILYDKYGNPETIISLSRDVTEKMRLEKEILDSREKLRKLNEDLEVRVNERTKLLEAANKELEAFSYSVSHDLRAPLRAIDGFSKMLSDDYNAAIDDNGKRVLNIIRSNVKKMGQLIDDLLAFSRLGRKEVNFSEVDMKSLFVSIYHEQVSLYKGVSFNFVINSLPNAFADINLMKHVISNLLSNALKFSSKKENPQIEISGYIENDLTIFSVKDNGAGFNMKYSDKLFGVFQRLHSEDEFEGTGVGLAIVQRIIIKHKGRVWAVGKPGEGAEFFFSLPVGNKKSKNI